MERFGTMWKGTVAGHEAVVNVVGTYGDINNPTPVVVVDEGDSSILFHKLAIDWDSGDVIRDFGSVL